MVKRLTFDISFESEAIPGTIPQGQNNPRCVRFGLYAEQVTASAFVAPRHTNKKAWLYRVRPAVAHQGFVSLHLRLLQTYYRGKYLCKIFIG
jgi:homogentisate 1,2-dioxygenase